MSAAVRKAAVRIEKQIGTNGQNLGDFFFRASRTPPSGNEIQDMLSDKLRSIDVHVMGSARYFDEPSASPS